ncbi:MAG: hypothetical protein WD022_02965 [Balneolaceae bacterium]
MSIPFNYSMYETSGVNGKVKEVKGILSFIDGELLFEYKVYDMNGNGLSNLSKFSIQLDHIKRIEFKKGLFFSANKLIIEANQWAFFEPLPGSEQGKVTLRIKRTDKNEAIRFSTKMNLYMSRKRLSEMDD